MASSKEENLWAGRPAMFRAHPIRFVVLCVVVGVLLILGVGVLVSSEAEAKLTGYTMLAVAGTCGLMFFVWWLKVVATRYRVTNTRSMAVEGILSRRTREVRHSDIRFIAVNQSITDRLLNMGTVQISSAGQSGVELEFQGIATPTRVRELIDHHRPG